MMFKITYRMQDRRVMFQLVPTRSVGTRSAHYKGNETLILLLRLCVLAVLTFLVSLKLSLFSFYRKGALIPILAGIYQASPLLV